MINVPQNANDEKEVQLRLRDCFLIPQGKLKYFSSFKFLLRFVYCRYDWEDEGIVDEDKLCHQAWTDKSTLITTTPFEQWNSSQRKETAIFWLFLHGKLDLLADSQITAKEPKINFCFIFSIIYYATLKILT